MRFGRHVFISYAHIDNAQGASPGWVDRLHGKLDQVLSTRLGRQALIWRDRKLTGNDVFAQEIVQQLPDCAVLVSVVSPRYVASDWCLREANTYCDAAQAPPGLVVDNKSRLFKVIKGPPPSQATLPAPMRDTLGFDFYVHSKDGQTESRDTDDPVYELDACYSLDLEKKFNVAVARLAWDITQTLDRLDQAEAEQDLPAAAVAAANAAAANSKPTVYLAECGYDRREDREALRSELAMRGYPVLPDRPLPQDEAACREQVATMLARSKLVVQLVGAAPGAVPDGPAQQSVVLLQNALAVRQAHVAALPRLLSVPAGTSCSDPSHQAFIDALHRDSEAQFGADLVTADLEAVKAAMRAALARIEAPAPAPPEQPLANGAATVYVIFDEPERKATVPLRKALAARGLNLQTPVFDGDAAEVRRANQDGLTQCDAVLVFYGGGTEAWRASVESDLRRAGALRGARPPPQVFTWLAGPDSAAKADAVDMEEPGLIDGRSGFDEALLAPLFALMHSPQGDGHA